MGLYVHYHIIVVLYIKLVIQVMIFDKYCDCKSTLFVKVFLILS